jgi:hypothetical protein
MGCWQAQQRARAFARVFITCDVSQVMTIGCRWSIPRAIQFSGVLARLDPAIRVYAPENVDARVKHEHDSLELNCPGSIPACAGDLLDHAPLADVVSRCFDNGNVLPS